jgi:hypothetical protein
MFGNYGAKFDETNDYDKDTWNRLVVLLGTTAEHVKDNQQILEITRNIRIMPTVSFERYSSLPKKNFLSLVQAMCGEIRTLWAALLLINQHHKKLQFQEVPRQIANTYKGRKVYLAHTLVSIPMHTPIEARRLYYPAMRASPVGHEVRGHWANFHLAFGCDHAWPLFPNDEGRFVCKRCLGFRRWKNAFHRGHSGEGYNKITYEIKP